MMKLSLIVLLSLGAADGFVTPGLFLLHRMLSSADERCVCVRAFLLLVSGDCAADDGMMRLH